ncbi:diadenylate cyclase CdaA [Paenibacillus sp. KN14-4R]|uniref:diadenylate cyclase CdaA n=1 Tax=Paenibacillus sp. KN14-4R TaxID=3445773 RepID=UPI003FA123CE
MEFLGDFGIKDVIDILIVTYVVYKLIMLVRGTRAIQFMKGIIVVVVAWALSSKFQLTTLQWMMKQMIDTGLIAIIILFQPELRRALEQIGRGKLFARTYNGEDHEMNQRIGEVMKALNILAKREIGALIVFEKETGLSEYMESGTMLESKISSELLVNIFTPNTPLHDGAVIIRGNQLVAAACYLPLSENPFISKELGTRHRASIGMSEVSDALCVTVSEETGQISLAMNGQIVRGITEESLITKLFDELRPKKTKRESGSLWKKWGGRLRG